MSRPFDFLRGFFRNPRGVGSVWPSSRFLAQRIAEAGDAATARLAVELGPGTGAVTRELLEHLPAEARLVALEISPEFVTVLRGDIADPRLTVHLGPSTEITAALAAVGEERADLVVSGIPFSTMPAAEGRRTLEAVREALAPGGRFVAYQVRETVAELARPILGEPVIVGELLNLPPMRIYTWRR
ncbi:MAG TPA: methyltransferase [Thermoanaerobaculia bacterium]|nr:methyltransferase [Thermoanaerobaculia bacterium]